LLLGVAGTTPKKIGPLPSNRQVKNPLGQGSLSLKGYGNPEGSRSRDRRSCRDFSRGDFEVRVIDSPKHGRFELLVDRQDLDIVKWAHVQKHRNSGGVINFYPKASKNGRRNEEQDYCGVHKLVAERVLGRPMKKKEVVHHIDGNPFNCRRCNLAVMTLSEHARLHGRMGQEFMKEHFKSPLDDDSLQLLKKLLGRKMRIIRGMLQVIAPDKGIVHA